MNLSEELAESLCKEVMSTLLEQGSALRAALQAAGHERKMEGWIQQGMKKWLAENANHLICITEYRHIDFAFIEDASVGENTLIVDTVFEAKVNYTSQNAELINRPVSAIEQLRGYRDTHNGIDGYLLYLLADHAHRTGAELHHDKGWHYIGNSLNGRFEAGVRQLHKSVSMTDSVPLAEQTTRNFYGWDLHLALFK